MALVVKDRVKETTTSTGTGTVTLAGATQGYQSFSVVGDGNTTYYTITNGTDWEVGIGTYTATGTTLSRDTILESSNSGAAVNFSAGTKDVFVTYPAEKAVTLDGTETLTNKTINGSNNTITNVSLTTGITGTLAVANGGTGATTAAGALTNLGAYAASNPAGYTTNTGTVTSVAASAGTGISVTGSPITTSGTLTITNTAPDQTVTLTQAGTTTITGTYPNFTISSADQYSGTVTSVGGTGTVNGLTLSGTVTSSGNLTLGGTLAISNADWSGTDLSVANGGTGTSSLTSGYVLKGNGTSPVTSSVIYDNGTNVGIGTSSPTNLLHVSATGFSTPALVQSTSTVARIAFRDAGTTDSNTVRLGSAGDAMSFLAGGSERARITSAGLVGIGTSSPGTKLTVNGGAEVGVAGGTSTAFGQKFWPITAGNSVFNIYADVAQMRFTTGGSYDHTANTSLMVLTNTGNLGIGTSSPNGLLEVNGGTGVVTSGGTLVVRQRGDTNADGIALTSSNATSHRIWKDAAGALNIGPSNLPSALVQNLSGNVGIGTTSPTSKLTVSSSGVDGIEISQDAGATGQSGRMFWTNATSGQGVAILNVAGTMDFRTGAIPNSTTGTQRLTISTGGSVSANIDLRAPIFYDRDNTAYYLDPNSTGTSLTTAGSVGIGTTSPAEKLNISGSGTQRIRITETSSGAYGQFTQSTTNVGIVAAHTSSDNYINFLTTSSGAVAERMRITSTGDVGIGTTAPDGKLHISGTTASPAKFIWERNDGAVGARNWLSYIDSSHDLLFGKADDSGNLTNDYLHIESGGNIGIGTSSPAEKLTVSSGHISLSANYDIKSPDGFAIYDTSAALDRFTFSTSNVYAARTGGNHIFNTAATERMRIDSSGNVGIGRTAPSYKLDVIGDARIRGYTIGVNPSDEIRYFFTNDGGASYINSGNVGISTTTPTYRLDISDGGYTMKLGADQSATTRTNATDKYARVGFAHYTNAEESAAVFVGIATSGGNSLSIGGGSSLMNALTSIQFYTAANNTTVTGSERMRIDSSGRVGIGTTSPAGILSVASGSSTGTSIGSWSSNYSVFGPNVGSAAGAALGLGYNTSTDTAEIVSIAPGVAWKNMRLAAVTLDLETISGRVQTNQSFRAPIFYDSDNTAYYTDPASTSVLNALTVGGSSVLTASTTFGGDVSGTYNAIVVADNSHNHIAPNVTGGVLGSSGQIGLSYHPEAGALLIPSFDNDLSFVTQKGGTVSFYYTTDTTYTAQSLTNTGSVGFSTSIPFNGKPNYSATTITATSAVVVCDIEMPFNLSYGNTFYVDFGNAGWRAKDVTFYAYQTADNAETTYKQVGSATVNGTNGLVFTSGSYSHAKASGGTGYAYNRLRVVMTNWNGTNPRIAAIGAVYYNSSKLANTLLSLEGGTVYGTVTSTADFRAPRFYDSNNTAYYVDPAATSILSGADFDGIVRIATGSVGPANTTDGLVFDGNYTNGQYRHRFRKRDDSGGVPLYLDYAAAAANSYTELMKFGPNTADSSALTIYGQGYATGNFRAPIFYDSDNTAFYFDGASTTNINTLAGNGKTLLETSDSYLRINQSAAFGSGIWIGNSNFAQSSGAYAAFGSNGGTTNSRVYIYGGTYNGANAIAIDGANGRITVQGDIRAPIFYDSTNTAKLVDPSSTSKVGTDNSYIQIGNDESGKAGVIGNTATTDGTNLSYGTYWAYDSYYNGSNWAALRTTLGRKWMVDMGYHVDKFRVRAYGGAVSSPWADSAWTNVFTVNAAGQVEASGDFRAPIFYDSGDTAYYVNPANGTSANFAGTVQFAATTQSKLNLYATSYQIGIQNSTQYYRSNSRFSWFRGGVHSNSENDAGTGGTVAMTLDSSSNLIVTGSSRAPIFYDSDNTGYYVDPASTSVFNAIQADTVDSSNAADPLELCYTTGPEVRIGAGGGTKPIVAGTYARPSADTGYLDGRYGSVSSNSTVNPIYCISTGYAPTSSTALGSMYGIGYTDGATSGVWSGGGWGMYAVANGTVRHFLDAGNGIGYTTGSYRAPIFYDIDNTGYYVDPANGSYTNGNFRFGDDYLVIRSNGIEQWATNANAEIAINYFGYAAGTTQFRDFRVYNGKTQTRLSVFGSANYTEATGSLRAPIFYDSDATGYYVDPNSTSVSFRGRGEILIGGNTSGKNLRLGGNAGTNSVGNVTVTNGNLHIDAENNFEMYLNHYSNADVYVGNGGGFLYAYNSIRAPIFYDSNNTAYYLDPNSTGTSLNVAGKIYGVNEFYTSTAQNSWAFRATTGASSNSSGLWFTGETAMLLLRDSSGNIITRLAADGSTANNQINGNPIFHDGYHPNADKWTTARTLSLTGDVTGSVSWDGSGNASLSATVVDDSHNHIISNVDGLQTALDAKANLNSPSFTGAPLTGGFEIGYRKVPLTSVTGVTADASIVGRGYLATSTVVVPANVFSAGDIFSVINNSALNISISQGTGLTMRLVGTATTGSRILAQRGIATIMFVSATECIVTGVT